MSGCNIRLVFNLLFRPKTIHCSKINAYTSEITFLALVPWANLCSPTLDSEFRQFTIIKRQRSVIVVKQFLHLLSLRVKIWWKQIFSTLLIRNICFSFGKKYMKNICKIYAKYTEKRSFQKHFPTFSRTKCCKVKANFNRLHF